MIRKEFVKWIQSEVTCGGMIKINFPDSEIERIIDRELKVLEELNPDSQIDAYTVIPVQAFYTPEFRATRTFQFPDCVLTVTKFEEMKRRNAMFGIMDPDFSFNRCFQADLWLGSQMNMDSVAFRTIQWSVWDQLKQFTLVNIQHKWNYVEHKLLVLGHDPKVNVFCGLKVKADEQQLFDNAWVRKWIAAHCKLQAIKALTFIQTQQIGGATLNTQAMQAEADNDINDCKAKFIENAKVPHIYTIP